MGEHEESLRVFHPLCPFQKARAASLRHWLPAQYFARNL
jgi:hypothetical protein